MTTHLRLPRICLGGDIACYHMLPFPLVTGRGRGRWTTEPSIQQVTSPQSLRTIGQTAPALRAGMDLRPKVREPQNLPRPFNKLDPRGSVSSFSNEEQAHGPWLPAQ